MSEFLLVETIGPLCVLTMNRPERLNALTSELLEALISQFEGAAADPHIRGILLTGAGRGFCAGADLGQSIGGERLDLGRMIDLYYNPLTRTIRNCPKPVICAVNGVAAGAGMNIALAGDIVIAASSANFTQAFVKIGLLPDAGGTYFLSKILGDARARALAMLGDTVSADEAVAMGMIWKVISNENFISESMDIAAQIVTRPPQALAAIKQALNAASTNSLEAQLELERDLQRKLGYTDDFAEGVAAFIGKRQAMFTGS